MAILPVTVYGDKILRKKVDRVENVDFKTVELIKNMFDTMRNSNGIGLAANQVGANTSIFVIDISIVEGYENYKPLAVINPEITFRSEETIYMEEGCLSIPDVRHEVERPKKIILKYYDSDMKEQILEADELLARVLQHEFDHLQGVLFIDYFDNKAKKEFNILLNKIKNRDIEIEYPITEDINYQLT
ncbi:MAG: peptide deformylase [Ignavibacteriaceae bacterium]